MLLSPGHVLVISKEPLPVTLHPGALNQYLPTPVSLKHLKVVTPTLGQCMLISQIHGGFFLTLSFFIRKFRSYFEIITFLARYPSSVDSTARSKILRILRSTFGSSLQDSHLRARAVVSSLWFCLGVMCPSLPHKFRDIHPHIYNLTFQAAQPREQKQAHTLQ